MFTRWDTGSANIWCWGATSWLWCPTSSWSSTQAATSPSTAGRMRSSERFERCLSIKPHNSNQVLHGLLGWQSRPAGGGGVRLRYGEKSFCHCWDLTITSTNSIGPIPSPSSSLHHHHHHHHHHRQVEKWRSIPSSPGFDHHHLCTVGPRGLKYHAHDGKRN